MNAFLIVTSCTDSGINSIPILTFLTDIRIVSTNEAMVIDTRITASAGNSPEALHTSRTIA